MSELSVIWPLKDDARPAGQLVAEYAPLFANNAKRQGYKVVTTPQFFVGYRVPDGEPVLLGRAEVRLMRGKGDACGTPRGYDRHRKTLKEPACAECKAAKAKYERERKAAADRRAMEEWRNSRRGAV